jgi:hypothetical protein
MKYFTTNTNDYDKTLYKLGLIAYYKLNTTKLCKNNNEKNFQMFGHWKKY